MGTSLDHLRSVNPEFEDFLEKQGFSKGEKRRLRKWYVPLSKSERNLRALVGGQLGYQSHQTVLDESTGDVTYHFADGSSLVVEKNNAGLVTAQRDPENREIALVHNVAYTIGIQPAQNGELSDHQFFQLQIAKRDLETRLGNGLLEEEFKRDERKLIAFVEHVPVEHQSVGTSGEGYTQVPHIFSGDIVLLDPRIPEKIDGLSRRVLDSKPFNYISLLIRKREIKTDFLKYYTIQTRESNELIIKDKTIPKESRNPRPVLEDRGYFKDLMELLRGKELTKHAPDRAPDFVYSRFIPDILPESPTPITGLPSIIDPEGTPRRLYEGPSQNLYNPKIQQR